MNRTENPFQISRIDVYGDITEGESQQVFIEHSCSENEDAVELATSFSKRLAGVQDIACQDCQESITVVKKTGNISLDKPDFY